MLVHYRIIKCPFTNGFVIQLFKPKRKLLYFFNLPETILGYVSIIGSFIPRNDLVQVLRDGVFVDIADTKRIKSILEIGGYIENSTIS